MRGGEKIFPANGQDRKAGVAILISDKIDFKMKAIKKNKEGHYLMVKGSIQEEDITIINIYAPHIGASRYLQQIVTDNHSRTYLPSHSHPWRDPLDRKSRQQRS